MKARSWLWPDRAIGKRASRHLREEHNALVNSHAELLAALKAYTVADTEQKAEAAHNAALLLIAKAEKE